MGINNIIKIYDHMLNFKSSANDLTLGVEAELQLVDATNYDLTPRVLEILSLVPKEYKDKIKPEIFQSMIELNTGICKDAHEIEKDIRQTKSLLEELCYPLNIKLAGTASHPFALYWCLLSE